MKLEDFYALRSGVAPMPQGGSATLSVRDLGILRVPSGQLGASDPFVDLDDPFVVTVPPGDYKVKVTVADVSPEQDGSHMREAYLSVVLTSGVVASINAAPGSNGPPPEGQFFGVGVDAGTVAFADAEAVTRCMPEDPTSWLDDVFDSDGDSWFAAMDADSPLPTGTANVVMPRATAGENVVLSHSGWGDGFYPVLESRDSDGKLIGVHIDLQVVGPIAVSKSDSDAGGPVSPQGLGPWARPVTGLVFFVAFWVLVYAFSDTVVLATGGSDPYRLPITPVLIVVLWVIVLLLIGSGILLFRGVIRRNRSAGNEQRKRRTRIA